MTWTLWISSTPSLKVERLHAMYDGKDLDEERHEETSSGVTLVASQGVDFARGLGTAHSARID